MKCKTIHCYSRTADEEINKFLIYAKVKKIHNVTSVGDKHSWVLTIFYDDIQDDRESKIDEIENGST